MGFSNSSTHPSPEPVPWGVDPEETSQTRDGIAAPVFWGTQAVPVTWLCKVYRLRSQPSPRERPSKK